MKRLLLILLFGSSISFAQVPFSKGVNLTGWFQTSNAKQVQFTKFTKQDFINIKSLGCDVIRLPIDLLRMTNGAPDYTIDPLFFYFMDQIIDWTEELGMYLLLDNHAVETSVFTDPNLEASLKAMWQQVAERYKNRSNHIVYEIINEPHDITDSAWNAIQKKVLATIRSIDSKHTVMVTPAGWCSYNNLKSMPVYEDTNLIYSFHFYDPFLFTHQGASWTNPSMAPLAGVPFPYDAARMPLCPAALKGTWIESSMNSYRNDGTEKKIKELIGIAIKFSQDRKVPIFCGEFGVYLANSEDADRVRWYGIVPGYLTQQGIPWTMWDYIGGFGLFNKGGNDMFEYDVNVAMVQAMGLTPPPQKEFNLKSDSVGFNVYTDFIGERIFESSYASGGTIDFYSQDLPATGSFCIRMAEVSQYSNTGFSFKPIKDLSRLVDNGYAIDLWLRSDYPEMKIDIRFIDTKTSDPDDHPWRMRITIDKNSADWNGEWNHLQIPLNQFTEHGSWDNSWFEPQGDFDWTKIDRLEIVSEHHDFIGKVLYIDNVRIVDPAVVAVTDKTSSPLGFALDQNYPNPFNPATTIHYSLEKASAISIKIHDVLGHLVTTLVDGNQPAGQYQAIWDGRDEQDDPVSSGVYFCTMQAGEYSRTFKMVLAR